jgi:hypothetical protein
MHYIVEPIGAQFANKDLPNLAQVFSSRVEHGYRLHSVFQVTQPPGCALFGAPKVTYLAVYEATSLRAS